MTILIAELGINHDGSEILAKDLIISAKKFGCDEIKFQYRTPSKGVELSSELGFEIIKTEVANNYLSVDKIMNLSEFGKSLGLKVGISFFTIDDSIDFQDYFNFFDFFKIPAASNTDFDLIDFIIDKKKFTYISLGMTTDVQNMNLANRYKSIELVIPFHCISNYPTKIYNSQFTYINNLRKMWGKNIGYSSHDDNLLLISKVLDLNISHLERHITLDKFSEGLDKSSSSTPHEFQMFREYVEFKNQINNQVTERFLNQGEIINCQNLSKSLYSKTNLRKFEELSENDFYEKSPKVGLTKNDLKKLENKRIKKDIIKDEPLLPSHFTEDLIIDSSQIMKANNYKIGIPIRFHDQDSARDEINLNLYEYHLTFLDLKIIKNQFKKIDKNKSYSIHAPDYISSTQLLDLFSSNTFVREQSFIVLETLTEFSLKLKDLTGKTSPIIISLNSNENVDGFYSKVKELQSRLKDQGVVMLPQLLPPFAWYFGGSVKVNYFCNVDSFKEIEANSIDICFDLSHFLMICNFHKLNKLEMFQRYTNFFKHFHLSGAVGFDSEGLNLEFLDPEESDILKMILKNENMKILECWQGHLNKFEGFKKDLIFLLGDSND